MFTAEFLDKRRAEFAASIKSFRYRYVTNDGKEGTNTAYQQGATKINGDIIVYTLILPAVIDMAHEVTTVYMYDTEEPVEGKEVGELDNVGTAVNAAQTIMIKISVTYLETGTPSEEVTTGEG